MSILLTLPESVDSRPDPIEETWWSAYGLALEGGHDADPPDELTSLERRAWLAGYLAGRRELEAERLEWSDEVNRRLDDLRDGRDDRREAAEIAEMGSDLGHDDAR